MNGIELEELEDVDKVLNKLTDKDYKTFFLTNEVAGKVKYLFKKYYKKPSLY